jgi:hypothetical protein
LEPETTNIRSLTPPLTCAPRTRARLHAHYHRPTPPFAAHYRHPCPLCSAPTAGNTSPPPLVVFAASCHLLHHCHSTPEHHLAYHSPIKPPHQLPQSPRSSKKSTLQINPLCQFASNSIFHSLAPKITMLGDSWVEDCCTWFIVFGFLLCMMVILCDRILQWEEQRERKRQ